MMLTHIYPVEGIIPGNNFHYLRQPAFSQYNLQYFIDSDHNQPGNSDFSGRFRL